LLEREVARHRQLLGALLLQLRDRGQPLVLVHRVPCQQECEHVPRALVVGHVVEPRHLHAALHLGVRVGLEVGEQVAARGDVAALPGVAVAVDRSRAGTGDDRVLHVGAADDRRDRRVGLHHLLGDPRGAFSSICAIMIASISTWPSSSAPMPKTRSRYLPGMCMFQAWNWYCMATVISPYWPPSTSCSLRA